MVVLAQELCTPIEDRHHHLEIAGIALVGCLLLDVLPVGWPLALFFQHGLNARAPGLVAQPLVPIERWCMRDGQARGCTIHELQLKRAPTPILVGAHFEVGANVLRKRRELNVGRGHEVVVVVSFA